MRVLIVTGSFPPDRCGVGDYTASLFRSLSKLDHLTVGVLTSCGSRCKEVPEDRTRVLRSMRGWGMREVRHFARILNAWSPDIVHLQYPTQGYGGGTLPWLIPRVARTLGMRVVQTWHEPYSRSSALKLLIKATVPGGLVVVRPDFKDRLHRTLHWILWRKKLRFIRSASTLPRCTLDREQRLQLKTRLLDGQKRLIVFFGFVYRHKRVEQVFEIADPATDRIVVAGPMMPSDPYSQQINELAAAAPWSGKVTLTGYLPPEDVAPLLAVADAVVLPFQLGGGDWNTSIHAATQEGAFVITTSHSVSGYDARRNVYFARPDDTGEMKAALAKYSGRTISRQAEGESRWDDIAREHAALYSDVMAK